MFIKSSCRNWSPLHSPCFLPLVWLQMAPSQEPVLHLIFGEPGWSSEMLWTSPMRWSLSSCMLDSSMYWSSPSWSPCHLRPTDVSCDTSHQCASFAYDNVILSKMNNTLTVAMNPNWILYDVKSVDQSSQPQSFLWCLNCNHIFYFCRLKSYFVL